MDGCGRRTSSDRDSHNVKQTSTAIFRRLVGVEAAIHGASPDQVHLHEVGGTDAIVDVVGSLLGLRLLGVDQVYASRLPLGHGFVHCAHGLLPVPAPATLELLKGVPVTQLDVEGELVTPTGAAILTTVTASFGDAPPMCITQVGYGAGTRELPIPNLLRISIGTETSMGKTDEKAVGYEEDSATLIETNIDDMNPQWYEHVTARLFEAGALDVFLTPIQMKHGRPATQLSVLVAEEHTADTLGILFAETTTIGVRAHPMRRWKLQRETVSVETPYGPIDIKVARRGEVMLNVTPEYRDCQRIAREQGVTLKEVYRAAMEAVHCETTGRDK